MTTIQIRIDKQTKNSAKKVLDELGLDMSTAIKAYLKQISAHKRIPFPLITENGLTPEEEKNLAKAAKEAKRGQNVSHWYDSTDKMLDDLEK